MWLNKLKGTFAGVLAVLALAGVGISVVCHVPAHAQPGEDPAPVHRDKVPPPVAEPKPPFDPPPPRPEDTIDTVLSRWTKRTDALQSVVLHFEQTQNERSYEGTIKYLRPEQFLVEVRRKDAGELTERLIVNGEVALEMLPQQKRALRLRLSEQSLPMMLLGLKPDALRRRFDLHVAMRTRGTSTSPLPRAADRNRVSQARLVLNKETWLECQLWCSSPETPPSPGTS
jgi:hypothetical protein